MLAFAALLLAVPAAAQDVPEALTITYACADGASLRVAYLNPPGGPSYAVVLHDGGLVPMKAGLTGSGVRYVSIGEPKLVWHTKMDWGFLAHDDAGETMITGVCTAAPG